MYLSWMEHAGQHQVRARALPVVLTPTCYLKHAVTEENARTSLCFEPHLIDGLCQPTADEGQEVSY